MKKYLILISNYVILIWIYNFTKLMIYSVFYFIFLFCCCCFILPYIFFIKRNTSICKLWYLKPCHSFRIVKVMTGAYLCCNLDYSRSMLQFTRYLHMTLQATLEWCENVMFHIRILKTARSFPSVRWYALELTSHPLWFHS